MTDPNNKVRSVLESLVHDGREIGVQVAAYLDGKLVIDAWAGLADEASQSPVDGGTLFTAYSISKGITATCIHILADRGLIDYDAPIADYWPEFAAGGKARATIRHALTHRAGIPQDPPGFDISMMCDWDAVCQAVSGLEPLWKPGTRIHYHALTYGWMLGEVVRRVDGRSIQRFLQEEVCQPLGITDLYFGAPLEAERRIATLRNAPGLAESLSRMGMPPDHPLRDSAATFNRPEVRRAIIPGAGAIVNARSLARHYALLAGGGALEGVRLLSEERIAIAGEPQTEDPGMINFRWWTGHGLGYTLGGGPGPRKGLPHALGYEGVGTIGFADPSSGFAFAFLKNLLDMSSSEMDSATLVTEVTMGALGIA
ncbi:esterase a [hydrocarbon metagenome]|uniref:Esterase a n=1 Tax=hydrocarbon metagenome TaxID=938273 RepID=A0A0W8F0T7_9ZZZZ